VSEIGQGSHDAVIAPAWVFLRQAQYQFFGLLLDFGPTVGATHLGSIELISDQLPIPAQRPAFTDDTEISLERATGKYHVKTKARKDGREELLDGTLDLPLDVYNGGMVLIVAKNLPKGASETVHTVVFTPTPRLIQLELVPAGEHRVLVGELAKTATDYVFKPKLGIWLKLFATLLGRVPPDSHAWIVTNEVPAFVRFEGSLSITGPVWRIESTSPRWPD
jgi:hypothetical protein